MDLQDSLFTCSVNLSFCPLSQKQNDYVVAKCFILDFVMSCSRFSFVLDHLRVTATFRSTFNQPNAHESTLYRVIIILSYFQLHKNTIRRNASKPG